MFKFFVILCALSAVITDRCAKFNQNCSACTLSNCIVSWKNGIQFCTENQILNAELEGEDPQDCEFFSLMVSFRIQPTPSPSNDSLAASDSSLGNTNENVTADQTLSPVLGNFSIFDEKTESAMKKGEKEIQQINPVTVDSSVLRDEALVTSIGLPNTKSPNWGSNNSRSADHKLPTKWLLPSVSTQPPPPEKSTVAHANLPSTTTAASIQVEMATTAKSPDLVKTATALPAQPTASSVSVNVATTELDLIPVDSVTLLSKHSFTEKLESNGTGLSLSNSFENPLDFSTTSTMSTPVSFSPSQKPSLLYPAKAKYNSSFNSVIYKCSGGSFMQIKEKPTCLQWNPVEIFLFLTCKLADLDGKLIQHTSYAEKGFHFLIKSQTNTKKCNILKNKRKRCKKIPFVKQAMQLESYCPFSKDRQPIESKCATTKLEKSSDNLKLLLCKIADHFIISQYEINTLDYFLYSLNPYLHRENDCNKLKTKKRLCKGLKKFKFPMFLGK